MQSNRWRPVAISYMYMYKKNNGFYTTQESTRELESGSKLKLNNASTLYNRTLKAT